MFCARNKRLDVSATLEQLVPVDTNRELVTRRGAEFRFNDRRPACVTRTVMMVKPMAYSFDNMVVFFFLVICCLLTTIRQQQTWCWLIFDHTLLVTSCRCSPCGMA